MINNPAKQKRLVLNVLEDTKCLWCCCNWSKPTINIENPINISTMLILTVIKFKVPRAKVIECPIVNPVITSKSSLPRKSKTKPSRKAKWSNPSRICSKPNLKKEEFHLLELINLKVKILDNSEYKIIGKVINLENEKNNLLVIELFKNQKKVLIPFVEEIVPLVDLKNNFLTINPPDGLLEL